MTRQTFFLSSLDSTRFEPVRECTVERLLTFDTGKAALVARLTPGVVGQDLDLGPDVERVVLTARHEGTSVDAVDTFPCFVFVAIPHDPDAALVGPVRADDLRVIGWGELYRTRADAERHTFDPPAATPAP